MSSLSGLSFAVAEVRLYVPYGVTTNVRLHLLLDSVYVVVPLSGSAMRDCALTDSDASNG